MISFTDKLCVLFSAFLVVEGTLTPDGTVPLDCGTQQTFTCSVTGVSAVWNSSGLSGIVTGVAGVSGFPLANSNARITTTDASGVTQSSTITITGFTTSDNGGIIHCVNQADGSVQGMASISVEPPSCPTSFSANRDGDFTSATVTYQLVTTPPVTSTTVTYCPTSSPNCGNSMNCISPCTISGLDPCVEYNLSAIPNNNCGSPTGCTGNNMVVASRGVPSCPSSVVAVAHDNNDAITVTWQQPPNTPPVTFTTVTYCPTSSPNCGDSINCTSPCTISGLDPGTEYQFTVIPNNNCGSPTGCTGNNATAETACICTLQPSLAIEAPLLAGIIPTFVLLLANVVTGVFVFLITRHCYKNTSQKSSPSKGEDVYEQVEGPKTCEDIVMTDSPAYGPVK